MTPSGQRQINVRLPAKVVGIIDAAATLDEISIAEYLKPKLEELADSLGEDHAVQTIIRLRAEQAAKKEGKLSSLAGRKAGGEAR